MPERSPEHCNKIDQLFGVAPGAIGHKELGRLKGTVTVHQVDLSNIDERGDRLLGTFVLDSQPFQSKVTVEAAGLAASGCPVYDLVALSVLPLDGKI